MDQVRLAYVVAENHATFGMDAVDRVLVVLVGAGADESYVLREVHALELFEDKLQFTTVQHLVFE